MIADSYLQLRNELEAAVTGLLKLAGEMQRTAPWLDMLQSFVAEIRQPLLLVVVGESKSGKSSVLNALFGADLGGDAKPGQICVFQYGREAKSLELTSTLRELYLPAAFLRDLKIVDTPGLEKFAGQTRQTVVEFASRADLVLLVLSLQKPWSAATWEFLTRHELPLKNFVFVLQQADLREPKEIAIIRRNLEDDAKQKLGFTPPIFAISERDAFVGHSTGSPNERPERQSDFDGLKEQINLVVTQSGGRTQQLRLACQLAQLVLHDIASELRACVEAVAHDERRLMRAAALRQVLKEQTLRQMNDALARLEGSCREQIRVAAETIKRKLAPAKLATLLRSSGGWLLDFEAEFAPKRLALIEQQLDETAQVWEAELRGVWPQVHDTIDQQLVTDAREHVPQAGPDLAQQKRDLLETLGHVVPQHLSGNASNTIQVVSQLSAWLRASLTIAVLSALFAVVTSKLSVALAIALASVAICAGVAGAAVAWVSRKRILRAHAHAQYAQLAQLQQIVGEQFRRAVDTFHHAVVENLQPLVEHCETQRRSSEPLLRRAEELQRTLGGLSSRLR